MSKKPKGKAVTIQSITLAGDGNDADYTNGPLPTGATAITRDDVETIVLIASTPVQGADSCVLPSTAQVGDVVRIHPAPVDWNFSAFVWCHNTETIEGNADQTDNGNASSVLVWHAFQLGAAYSLSFRKITATRWALEF